ncbi:MAG: hypothetical protein KIH69_023780 [Anaerolineae bacterium]|nr:hypothetical protein [Anaerolineae bacterium]
MNYELRIGVGVGVVNDALGLFQLNTNRFIKAYEVVGVRHRPQA